MILSDSAFFLAMLIISVLLLWVCWVYDNLKYEADQNERKRLAAENEQLKQERDRLTDKLSHSYGEVTCMVRGKMYKEE